MPEIHEDVNSQIEFGCRFYVSGDRYKTNVDKQ